MLLAEAIEDFYAEQEYKGNSAKTVLFDRVNFEHFLRDTVAVKLEQFSEKLVPDWLVAHRGLSPNTLETYDRALRCLADQLFQRSYIEVHPMKDLPKPRAKRIELITFTEDEIRAMLAEAGCRQAPLRDRALIMLLLDTGVRIGEVCGLELRSIQWVDSSLIVDGKTGPRQIPFGRKVKAALRLYIDRERRAAYRGIDSVFLNCDGLPMKTTMVTQRLAKIAVEAGVNASKTGCHIFRHTFAVEYLRAGGDAFTLQPCWATRLLR